VLALTKKERYKDWLMVGFLVVFATLTALSLVSIVYAKKAEQRAREVRRELTVLNVSAQNRCMVLVVLTYPPPINETQYDKVMGDFDKCVRERPTRNSIGGK
jgi:hypothetical protein